MPVESIAQTTTNGSCLKSDGMKLITIKFHTESIYRLLDRIIIALIIDDAYLGYLKFLEMDEAYELSTPVHKQADEIFPIGNFQNFKNFETWKICLSYGIYLYKVKGTIGNPTHVDYCNRKWVLKQLWINLWK